MGDERTGGPGRRGDDVRRATRRTLASLVAWFVYWVGVRLLADTTVMSQALSPKGSSGGGVLLVLVFFALRIGLVLVLPVMLVRWWLPIAWKRLSKLA